MYATRAMKVGVVAFVTAAAVVFGPPAAQAAVPSNNVFPVVGVRSCVNNFSPGGHEGTDCFANKGTPLVAVESGTMYYRRTGAGYNCATRTGDISGNRVSILGASGTRYYYGHMDVMDSWVQAGVAVQRGQRIGTVGNTGNACSSPHLHFQLWLSGGTLVNPYPYLISWAMPGSGGDAYNPIGYFDAIVSRSAGQLGIWGWTVDPDTPTSAISVHVYITYPNGYRTNAIVFLANVYRGDVGAAYPAYGPYHGYDRTWTGLGPGTYTVDVYGIDSSGRANDYTTLGRKSIRVS
jgi:hypothetical protein